MELQTLQYIFYTMGIVFMTLIFLSIVALVVMVFYIKAKIGDIQKQIEDNIEHFKENAARTAGEMVVGVGAGIASAGAKKIKEMMKKEK
jgi:uncharacterized membrane protein